MPPPPGPLKRMAKGAPQSANSKVKRVLGRLPVFLKAICERAAARPEQTAVATASIKPKFEEPLVDGGNGEGVSSGLSAAMDLELFGEVSLGATAGLGAGLRTSRAPAAMAHNKAMHC